VYNPVGLEGWEIVAASGLCAIGFLMVSTVFAVTMAWFFDRERAPATKPVAVPKPAARPATSPAPEYAAATA
jgi:hypothetical protein